MPPETPVGERELMLVLCRAALYIIAYLNRRYQLRLRVPAVEL